MNPFELDVYERLTDAGLQVDSQYGVGGYRLDFAIRHPTKPGLHVLAVETDGAAYHSGWTARERDRLRQQQLESLGWRFHRIWSADYWRDPEAEIESVLQAVRTAVSRLDEGLPAADDAPELPGSLSGHATERSQRLDPLAGSRRPPAWVTAGRQINAYSDAQLVSLVEWLRRDGKLRLPDDELTELMDALGYSRRGQMIVTRLNRAMGAADRAARGSS